MKNQTYVQKLTTIAEAVKDVEDSITFKILEIGALPINGAGELFHKLLEIFPGTEIIAFEVDKELCEKLNSDAKPGMKYFPVALGEDKKDNDFYVTNHPMCCSLYKPNEKLLELYNNLNVAQLKTMDTLDTQSLDTFIKDNDIGAIDFIKIDIQGAELKVFENGKSTLKDVLGIITEVEFIPLYENQPLFGDVTKFLSDNEFMFHKFLDLASRSLKPLLMNNNANMGSQHMWSDAFYVKSLFTLPQLDSKALLKLGIIAFLYGSIDLTHFCFNIYDERHQTDLKGILFKLF